MFPEDMSGQRKKLGATLKLAVSALTDLDALVPALESLGERHAGYGVRGGHFDVVGAALLSALSRLAGDAWTTDLERAWAHTYGLVATTMREAMERYAARTERSPLVPLAV
jgi:nitric oxide dioxygenase